MKQRMNISKATPSKGAMDFSNLLEAPAGCHGFVTTKNGHFYFEDGKRAKFFGFCISARSNTPSHEDAKILAQKLATLGVNVVRMHAIDAPMGDELTWSSSRETPLIDYAKETSRLFCKEGLDRFDYLFSQFKKRGIYVHIDLIVAREFFDSDNLDYPGGFVSCGKRFPMYNKRLIELQKEYAKNLLTHVNPYTGLRLVDDPAVMTVQINNEESAIKGCDVESQALAPYRKEVADRFGKFLLDKYGSRDELKKAWTMDGICALGDEEDPANGTVSVPVGSFYQPTSEPMGAWDGSSDFMAHTAPARYSDFIEFGTAVNKEFYSDMYEYLHSIGVRVPIACSNLVAGAADVYGHSFGDVMENDSYFNHPMFPLNPDGSCNTVGPMEYVSVNPLTAQTGVGAMGTTLLSLGAEAAVDGKPMTLAEWNEYGLHPFHSTAYAHTVAYALLNDWDALILYNYHTSEKMNDEPGDEIHSVFNCFNDPSLIAQWGTLATVFLKGLVKPSNVKTDIVYTKKDITTSPTFGYAPYMLFPYICNTRSVYLDDDKYVGNADVAVNSGFFNDGDLSKAKHGVYYAWSPYTDVFRTSLDENRLTDASKDEKNLVIDDIIETAGMGNYTEYANLINEKMHEWGVLPEGTGIVDGALVSDTGELITDGDNNRFEVHADDYGCFSGAPTDTIKLSNNVTATSKNDRITLSLLKRNENEYLLTAVGASGTEDQQFIKGPEFIPGMAITTVVFAGKLYADTFEGTLTVDGENVKAKALDINGSEIGEIESNAVDGKTVFTFDGSVPATNFAIYKL